MHRQQKRFVARWGDALVLIDGSWSVFECIYCVELMRRIVFQFDTILLAAVHRLYRFI